MNSKHKLHVINAFTERDFGGNPAAVCPLEQFFPNETMQAIAEQNNLSETAFIVFIKKGHYEIRWFSPTQEVELCGHATLAAAWVIFNYLDKDLNQIVFNSASGPLQAIRKQDAITLVFPARNFEEVLMPESIRKGINCMPELILKSDDYLVILNNQNEIESLEVDLSKLLELDLRGVIFTAPGDEVDFVSRVFHPKLGIGEDPVCGSAHCELMPYWSQRLKKNKMKALQLSSRMGTLECEIIKDQIMLNGKCKEYLYGEIYLSETGLFSNQKQPRR